MPSVLILGIDPGLSPKKPMAMTVAEYREDDTRHMVSWCPHRIANRCLEDRISDWTEELEITFQEMRMKFGRLPDMVAIEYVRAKGKGGAHMQCLITFLKERAEQHGIRVELINPSTVKLDATGYGASSTEEAATIVRSEYKGADKLPLVAGEYDLEMALAIAGSGYAILQKEARLADES